MVSSISFPETKLNIILFIQLHDEFYLKSTLFLLSGIKIETKKVRKSWEKMKYSAWFQAKYNGSLLEKGRLFWVSADTWFI